MYRAYDLRCEGTDAAVKVLSEVGFFNCFCLFSILSALIKCRMDARHWAALLR